MEWRRGQVARSLAGHDKGTFLAVLGVAPPYAVVADGKGRPLERPKRKKVFHLAPAGTALPEAAAYAAPCGPFKTPRRSEVRRFFLCQSRT